MARDDKPTDRGKVRVRVIEFDMEGSNQTLRDSIKDIVGAIGKAQIQRPTAPAALPSAKRSNGGADEPVSDESDEVAEDAEFAPAAENEPVARTNSRGPRRPKTPKPVSIDLRDGEISLRDFLTKAPDSIEKRYILIAYWFKKFRDVPEISQDHVYTAFTEMDWTNLQNFLG